MFWRADQTESCNACFVRNFLYICVMEITSELKSVIRQIVREELAEKPNKKNKSLYSAKDIAPIVSWWLYTRGFGPMARVEHKYEVLSKVTGYSVHTFRNAVSASMVQPSTDMQIEIMRWLDERLHEVQETETEYMDGLSRSASRAISMKLVKDGHGMKFAMWSQSVADYFEHCYNQFQQRTRGISI